MSSSPPPTPPPTVGSPSTTGATGSSATLGAGPRGCFAAILCALFVILLIIATLVDAYAPPLWGTLTLDFSTHAGWIIPIILVFLALIPAVRRFYDKIEENLGKLYQRVRHSPPSLNLKKGLFRGALVMTFLIISVVPYFNPTVPTSIHNFFHPNSSPSPKSSLCGAICETKINDQWIGLSDGRYVFDMRTNIQDSSNTVPNGRLNSLKEKQEGAKYMLQGSAQQALSSFNQALKDDPSDGETHIYKQNASLLALNPRPAMAVIVVPTTLTGPSSGPGQAAISAGQADLQGLAIEQEKINMKSGRDCLLPQQGGPCLKLYVMVANIGTDNQNDVYADQIAQQIINLKQDEKYTLLGAIGWPRSTNNTIAAIRKLGDAHILTVSPTASTDALSGISPYFFRVIPPEYATRNVCGTICRKRITSTACGALCRPR